MALKLPRLSLLRPRSRRGLLTGGGFLLTAVAVVLLNLLGQTLHVRWDWTRDHRYSLSPATKNLLRSLQDPLLVRFYATQGLPQPYEAQSRYVRDLLGEYRAAGGGKVRVEEVRPEGSEKAKSDADTAGLVPARVTQVANDEFQVREVYLGLTLTYQDKQKTLPFIQNTDALEYDLSSRVKQMTASRKPVLGFVEGHGESTPEDQRQTAVAFLLENFEGRPVRLDASTAAAVDLLLVMGPKKPYAPAEVQALDAHVAKGVPAVFFLNRRVVPRGSFRSSPLDVGLDPFLAHYGVRLDEDFVLDAQCQRITLQSRQGPYTVANIVNYPPLVLANDFDKAAPPVKAVDVLGFPFVHPLRPTAEGSPSLKFTSLARSSRHSWTFPGLATLDPYALPGPSEEGAVKGPFTLAALVEGSTSAFSDPSARAEKVKIVVVGTSYFAEEGLPNPDGNAAFLMALAEWLTEDPYFLAIPSKGPAYRPLRQLPPPFRQPLKLFALFFLPVAVVAGGLWRWQRRAGRRATVRRFYAPPPAAPAAP